MKNGRAKRGGGGRNVATCPVRCKPEKKEGKKEEGAPRYRRSRLAEHVAFDYVAVIV